MPCSRKSESQASSAYNSGRGRPLSSVSWCFFFSSFQCQPGLDVTIGHSIPMHIETKIVVALFLWAEPGTIAGHLWILIERLRGRLEYASLLQIIQHKGCVSKG